MREGIFSGEDIAQLENGYSVSDTDGDRTHMNDGDILSFRSGISGGGGQLASALLEGSPNGLLDHRSAAQVDSNLPNLLMQQRQNVNLNSEAALMRQGDLENQIRNQE